MRALFLACLLLCPPDAVLALETRSLPPSSAQPESSALTARTNLTEEWKTSGAARLYWNTLVSPRQLQMGGASFKDPASVPELLSNPPSTPKSRKTSVQKPKTPIQAASQPAPANAGSTALKAPTAVSGAAASPPPKAASLTPVPKPEAAGQK
ncbi:MAG: hypothetical protein LBC94_09405 [Desulfovibrio sp.]|nr:hypothetical protein [Desulfovibrio sp.]